MRRAIRKIREVLHIGEDIEFLNTLLEYVGLRPRDLIFGVIGSGAMGIWRAWEGATPAELALYVIAAFVIILAGFAIGRLLFGDRASQKAFDPPILSKSNEQETFEPDISARDAFFQVLDSSHWRDEQKRITTDTTNLRPNWLELRLSTEIHRLLRNSQLSAWGEECLQGTVTTPEKPIPPETWDKVIIVFDRNPNIPKTAAFFKGRVSFEYGRMAWVGIKFRSDQFFSSFPLSSAIDRVPCTALLKLAENEGWDFSSNTSLHLLDLQDAMRQGGLDNTLTIWGREKKFSSDQLMQSEPLQKISFDHWRDHYVHLFAAREGDNFNTYSSLSTANVGRRDYVDLHVQRSQAIHWLRHDAASFRGKTTPR